MNIRKSSIALALFVSVLMVPAARATEHDQASQLTFDQSIQIPGRVLPAGTYWFILVDSLSDRNIVQIFNADRSTLYATILTISAERPSQTDHTALTFATRESMPSNALVTWFYPGFTSGHEFVYSKLERQELSKAKYQTIMAMEPIKQQMRANGN